VAVEFPAFLPVSPVVAIKTVVEVVVRRPADDHIDAQARIVNEIHATVVLVAIAMGGSPRRRSVPRLIVPSAPRFVVVMAARDRCAGNHGQTYR
jgi:hypothetical protein